MTAASIAKKVWITSRASSALMVALLDLGGLGCLVGMSLV